MKTRYIPEKSKEIAQIGMRMDLRAKLDFLLKDLFLRGWDLRSKEIGYFV